MRSISGTKFLALSVLAGGLGAASASRVEAQEPFTVTASLADQGAKVWKSKACDACHSIGKGKRAGPDLAGALSRRTIPWLTQWMTNPPAMAASDSVGKVMVAEANGVVMPNFQLTGPQIEGLIHYVAREDEKIKAKAKK